MNDRIWVVSRYSRRDEFSYMEAAFLTEVEAHTYLNEREVEFINKLISLWYKARNESEVDFSQDEIDYTPEEQEFYNLTGCEPWDFSCTDSIEYEFSCYNLDWVPLIK